MLEALERAELAADPAAEVAELAADPAAEVMELRAEPGAPRADETCPRTEDARSPWAAAPAARKVVATTEKRILIDWWWMGLKGLKVCSWYGAKELNGLEIRG